MSLATTTVYLYIGFDNELVNTKGNWPDHIGGHFEVVDWLEGFAVLLEDQYETEFKNLEIPVVFEYEITEELGSWLYRNTHATASDFQVEARRLVKESMA